jgi:hypothetical protein
MVLFTKEYLPTPSEAESLVWRLRVHTLVTTTFQINFHNFQYTGNKSIHYYFSAHAPRH